MTDACPFFIDWNMRLSELPLGERARFESDPPATPLGARLRQLGVRRGETVSCLLSHPAGDPVLYLVGETAVAMRRRTADGISVSVAIENNYGEDA